MRWDIKHTVTATDPKQRVAEIVETLLKNRNLLGASSIEAFRHPVNPLELSTADVGIDPAKLSRAAERIHRAVEAGQPVLIYGDYDADGITATAILWEGLSSLGIKAYPFIPNRERHGYGLSVNGLKEALEKMNSSSLVPSPSCPLIVTVDNGIVAHEAISWLKNQSLEVIVTDHHTPADSLPEADEIIHSTLLCGAGVAWMLVRELSSVAAAKSLDLACIGTIADMMPVIGVNRSFVTYGLKALAATTRPGILALWAEAGIDLGRPLTSYTVGYTLAPRLNAMGRLDDALDSLRLLLTTNKDRAQSLAHLLGNTNRTRQDLTLDMLDHAKQNLSSLDSKKIIVIDHPDYHEGVIGLIAGKLVETYYRPAIVISRKEGISKASARSIPGVNITDLIRSQQHLLVGVGGHPMAAGFSIETDKIEAFTRSLTEYAASAVDESLLTPAISIDCEIDIDDVTEDLFAALEALEPFGIGNHQPVFSISGASIIAKQCMGSSHQHLKLHLERNHDLPIQALWFNHGDQLDQFNGSIPRLAFSIGQNTWRGKTSLQLFIKTAG